MTRRRLLRLGICDMLLVTGHVHTLLYPALAAPPRIGVIALMDPSGLLVGSSFDKENKNARI